MCTVNCVLVSASDCGRPKVNAFDGGSYRISSGREAPEGSAPWHVIIRETIHVRQTSPLVVRWQRPQSSAFINLLL